MTKSLVTSAKLERCFPLLLITELVIIMERMVANSLLIKSRDATNTHNNKDIPQQRRNWPQIIFSKKLEFLLHAFF